MIKIDENIKVFFLSSFLLLLIYLFIEFLSVTLTAVCQEHLVRFKLRLCRAFDVQLFILSFCVVLFWSLIRSHNG